MAGWRDTSFDASSECATDVVRSFGNTSRWQERPIDCCPSAVDCRVFVHATCRGRVAIHGGCPPFLAFGEWPIWSTTIGLLGAKPNAVGAGVKSIGERSTKLDWIENSDTWESGRYVIELLEQRRWLLTRRDQSNSDTSLIRAENPDTSLVRVENVFLCIADPAPSNGSDPTCPNTSN